jgi:hypothetical protein
MGEGSTTVSVGRCHRAWGAYGVDPRTSLVATCNASNATGATVTLADVRGLSAESCSPGAFNASLSVTLPTGVCVAGTLPPALQPLTDRTAPGAVHHPCVRARQQPVLRQQRLRPRLLLRQRLLVQVHVMPPATSLLATLTS